MLTGPQWFRFRGRGLRRAGAGDRGGRRGAERKVVAGAGCGEAELWVPMWRAGLPWSVLSVDHQRILQALADQARLHQGSLTCQEMAAEFGIDVVPARVEALRSKGKRLLAHGWLAESASGRFTLATGVAGPGSGSWQRHRPVALDDPPRGQHHETFWSSLRSTIVNTPARARQALLHETAGVAERDLCLGKPLPVRSPAPVVGRRSTRQPLTRPGAGTSLSLVDREWPSSGAHAVAVTYPPSRPPTCLERRRRTGGSSLPWPA